MTFTISLQVVVDKMDILSEQYHARLYQRTGKLRTVSDDGFP